MRFPFPERFAERLEGRRVGALTRRAKYLLAALDSGETLVMHLGMSGSFRVEDGEASTPGAFHRERSKAPAHDHVVFSFESGARVVYNDPRRFGYMKLIRTRELKADPLFRDLGVEPLERRLRRGPRLGELLEGARTPLKSALLDQRRIAGLGNIYVCEALHRARLSPMREAGSLPRGENQGACTGDPRRPRRRRSKRAARRLRDHRQTDGAFGYFQHSFEVYDREGAACRHARCGGTIARVVQNGTVDVLLRGVPAIEARRKHPPSSRTK